MTEVGTVNQAVAATGSLEARAARGAAWSMIGFAAGLALRLVGNVVLTRLLFEETFGLMLLVQAFLTGMHLFSDFGIGPSIIQNKRGDDPVFVNTAFTMQAGRGLILWMITWAGALPFAAFYDEPILAWVLPIAGFTALLEGLYSTKLLTANRELAMGRLTIIDLASQVAGLVVMMAWVTIRPSVWALVVGSIVSCVVRMVLSHTALPGLRNRLEWNEEARRAMLHFGKWIFVSTVLTFLASQSDRLIFGKLVDMKLLGVYNIAIILATLPAQGLGNITTKIIFPLFSRVYNEGSDLAAAYRSGRWPLLVLGGWATAGLVGGGPTVVRLFYDNRYEEAGWMLQIVAMGSWFGVLLENTNGAALLARGLARWTAAGSGGKARRPDRPPPNRLRRGRVPRRGRGGGGCRARALRDLGAGRAQAGVARAGPGRPAHLDHRWRVAGRVAGCHCRSPARMASRR